MIVKRGYVNVQYYYIPITKVEGEMIMCYGLKSTKVSKKKL
jgi:hypothetical protein